MATYGEYNPLDKAPVYILDDAYTIHPESSGGYDSVRSTFSKSDGKWYVEHTLSTITANWWVGFFSGTYAITGNSGNPYDKSIAMLRGASFVRIAGTSVASGLTEGVNGDVIGVALNLDDGEVSFYLNGVLDYTGPIAINELYLFAGCSGGGAYGTTTHTNFGQEAFTYSVPAGFNGGWYEGFPGELILLDDFKIGYEHPNWIKPGGVIPHKTFFPVTFGGYIEDGAHLDVPQLLFTQKYHSIERYFYWNHFRDTVDGMNIYGTITNNDVPIEASVKCYDQITDKYVGMCKGIYYAFNNLDKSRKYYLIAQSREDVDLPAIIINNITENTTDPLDPITDGLVGSWRFNDNLDDSSPNLSTGIGTPTYVTDRKGNLNNALETSSNIVTTPLIQDYNFNKDTPCTICMWFNVNGFPNNNLWLMGNFSSSAKGWLISKSVSKGLGFRLRKVQNSDELYTYTSTSINGIIEDGSWHHICFTYDGLGSTSGVSLYIDGVDTAVISDNNNLTSGDLGSTDDISLGTFTGRTNGYYVDDIKIFNKELSAQEVLDLYNV